MKILLMIGGSFIGNLIGEGIVYFIQYLYLHGFSYDLEKFFLFNFVLGFLVVIIGMICLALGRTADLGIGIFVGIMLVVIRFALAIGGFSALSIVGLTVLDVLFNIMMIVWFIGMWYVHFHPNDTITE